MAASSLYCDIDMVAFALTWTALWPPFNCFNLGRQYGCLLIVLRHQYGRLFIVLGY